MNTSFIRSMFQGTGNGVSSKRAVLIWIVLIFTYILIYNLHTGKSVSPSLLTMLDEAFKLTLIAVFGEPAIAALSRKKGTVTETTIVDDKSKLQEKKEVTT